MTNPNLSALEVVVFEAIEHARNGTAVLPFDYIRRAEAALAADERCDVAQETCEPKFVDLPSAPFTICTTHMEGEGIDRRHGTFASTTGSGEAVRCE